MRNHLTLCLTKDSRQSRQLQKILNAEAGTVLLFFVFVPNLLLAVWRALMALRLGRES
jgi:hypothetical protein